MRIIFGYRAAACCRQCVSALSRIAIVAVIACVGCSPRVSYSVRLLHGDPGFSGRLLSGADIVPLPLLDATGAAAIDEPDALSAAASLRSARRDLTFVPYTEFESGFPARFDRRRLTDFYTGIFREDILAVKAMDDVWAHVKHPYIMAFSLLDGAAVRNMDGSMFKHATVKCELWSAEEREVVWRASCKSVTDDADVSDARLIAECMRRLVETLPGALPNYGRENW